MEKKIKATSVKYAKKIRKINVWIKRHFEKAHNGNSQQIKKITM